MSHTGLSAAELSIVGAAPTKADNPAPATNEPADAGEAEMLLSGGVSGVLGQNVEGINGQKTNRVPPETLATWGAADAVGDTRQVGLTGVHRGAAAGSKVDRSDASTHANSVPSALYPRMAKLIKMIACSARHTLALRVDGQLWPGGTGNAHSCRARAVDRDDGKFAALRMLQARRERGTELPGARERTSAASALSPAKSRRRCAS